MRKPSTLHPLLPVAAFNLFVAPTGSDLNNGSLSAPFATLDKARQVVRALLPSAQGNINVVLRGGIHTLTSTVAFTSADSGLNGNVVRYLAYPGEVPVLSGGFALAGWTSPRFLT